MCEKKMLLDTGGYYTLTWKHCTFAWYSKSENYIRTFSFRKVRFTIFFFCHLILIFLQFERFSIRFTELTLFSCDKKRWKNKAFAHHRIYSVEFCFFFLLSVRPLWENMRKMKWLASDYIRFETTISIYVCEWNQIPYDEYKTQF